MQNDIYVFSGRAGLLTPVVYYQFLQLRLASRRNPFTRNIFTEITDYFNQIGMKPSVPQFIRTAILALVDVMRKMTPIRQQ